MTIDVVRLITIIVLASLFYWANNQLNRVPGLQPIINVLIVVVAILLCLQSMGLIGGTVAIR